MRILRRIAWPFLAILLLLPSTSLADYVVGMAHGLEKLRAADPIPDDETIHLYAAKNEWEMFQVLVYDDAGASGADVVVTPFTGPGEDIEDVELYRASYVPVTIDTISQKPPDVRKVGDWPDGLIPFVDHFVGETRGGAPFDVPAGENRAVYIDVYVPANQTAGDYTATVTVSANGRTDWTGTVTLTVWNFAIPTPISVESSYLYSQGTARNFHAAHGGITSNNDLFFMYMQEFARHRMGIANPIQFHPTYSWNYDDATFDWDWAEFDAFHGPLWDGTFYVPGYEFTSIMLPWAPGGRPGDVSSTDWEREWWAGWADHFRDQGWLEKNFLYLPDEPTPEQYPELADIADRLHNADEDLRAMVTEQFNDVLAGHVDIWDPDEPLFSDALPWPPYPEVYAERQDLGETIWWYNCVSAAHALDFANHFVDYPASQMRIWLWLTRRYGFTGILFWQTVYQYNYVDPWTTQYIDNWTVQGDGTMIYPGTIDHIGGTTDIPVASLRMKYLRESMEDYEYFKILDDLGENEWVSDVTRTVAPKSHQWEHDNSVLLDWRRKVAEKILGTLDETPPSVPGGLAAEALEESVRLTWTITDEADLAGYEVWYALYEGDEFFGGSLSGGATSALVTNLAAGREYSFWMYALDENGNRSASSAVVTATPLAGSDDDERGDGNSDEFEPSPNLVHVSDGGDGPAPDRSGADDDENDSAACGC